MIRSAKFAAVVGTGLLVAACGPGQDGQAGPAQRPPPEVGVIELHAAAFELVTELPGRTAPVRVAEVRPQVSGIVLERTFEEGSEVAAGQRLYRIDPKPYAAAVAGAQAELARAQAALEVARLRAERYAPLAKSGAVPRQDNDDVQAALRQARAQVAAAEAGLQSARIDLGYTDVVAPIAGVIGPSLVTEGALVSARQAPHLALITQLDPIYVDIQRPSAELLRLRAEFAGGRLERAGPDAARVGLRLEDGSVYPQAGTLAFSGVTVDPGTGSVVLRATFPNPQRTLLPGMYVRAQLSEGVEPDALRVPQQAVTFDPQGQARAMVVDDAGTVQARQVVTGRAVGADWLVESGLAAGDRVIVRGPPRLAPGTPVKPVPADAPPAPDKPGDRPPAGAAGHG